MSNGIYTYIYGFYPLKIWIWDIATKRLSTLLCHLDGSMVFATNLLLWHLGVTPKGQNCGSYILIKVSLCFKLFNKISGNSYPWIVAVSVVNPLFIYLHCEYIHALWWQGYSVFFLLLRFLPLEQCSILFWSQWKVVIWEYKLSISNCGLM